MSRTRISSGPIKIHKAHLWRTEHWGYVDSDFFEKLLWFEDPKVGNLKDKLKWSHASFVYQFMAQTPDRKDYMRMVACLGQELRTTAFRIQEVSWFDAHVKFRVLKVICCIRNWLFYKPQRS